MIKLKTSNTFEDGLIQDINPLNSELKNLYNCLNGTFISNDGDEMILLNDMGNSRVFLVKLDNGYVPVGMCVYGGVTYIASYNPITNKSLIGSFPSPQETYFSQSYNKDLGNNVELNTDKLEFVLKIFEKDTIIRPGDKFDIYLNEDNYNKYTNYQLVSNTNNVIDNKVKSPKNKAVTISVCVVDSNGNLHDITNTLKRFDITTGNEITFNEDDLVKLNTGTIFLRIPKSEGSEVDAYLVEPKNIYNYKMSGDLFLVYRLNTINGIDVSAEFFKGPLENKEYYYNLNNDTYKGENHNILEDQLDVIFDVTYKYNCPDGYYDNYPDNTGKYYSLYGSSEDYNPNKVIDGILGNYTINDNEYPFKLLFDAKNSELSKPVYDHISNLYTSKQRYILEGINIKYLEYLKFDLIPSTIYGKLDFFQQSLEIDLNLLESGVSVNLWRYFVEDSGININWGLLSYPNKNTRLTNVCLEFYNLSENGELEATIPITERTSYHGNFSNYVSFDTLRKRQVYCVAISYRITNIVNNLAISDNKFYAGYRILITTKLYNYIYNKVLDFSKLDNSIHNSLHTFILNSKHSIEDVYDKAVVRTDNVPFILTGEISDTITKTKNLDNVVKKKIISSADNIDFNLYPFDIDNISYTYNSLEEITRSSVDDIAINGEYISGEGYIKQQIGRGMDSVLVLLNNNEITFTGSLYSRFVGEKQSIDYIRLPKAIVLYFPTFSTKDPETGYVKDLHEKLFGYSATFKNTYPYDIIDFPYTIASGVTYRGLSGHDDHHGVKYIKVDKTGGDSTVNPSTATDLHSKIYGNHWDYPDVYAIGDRPKTFDMVNLLKNLNFIDMYKDRTFIFFRNEPYSTFTYYGDSRSPSYNVDNWIACDREGDEYEDYVIMNNTTKFLLFWRVGDEFILVKSGNDFLTPNSFSDKMSNIYTSQDITYNGCQILNPNNNIYNSNYYATFKYNLNVTPKYSSNIVNESNDYNTKVNKNIKTLQGNLNFDEDTKTMLENFSNFTFEKGSIETEVETSISMEGMEDILQDTKLISQGVYEQAVMIDSENKMYTKDADDKPLLSSSTYELYGNKPYIFGTKDTNNINNKYKIRIENGEVVPAQFKASPTIQLATGGDGNDQKTTLVLGTGLKYIDL